MVDQWSSTPPSPQEFPHKESDGFSAILGLIEKQKRELDEMRNNLLATAGISVEPDRLRVLGALAVDGTMDVSGGAEFGGTVNVTGDAVFSGDLAVPNGSITNAALSNPVTSAVGNAGTGVTPFPTSTSATIHATVWFTTPVGFTTAAVHATSAISSFVVPHTCATVIEGQVGNYTETGVDSAAGSGHTRILTGLTDGQEFTASTQVQAGGSGGFAHAMTSAMVTFYR